MIITRTPFRISFFGGGTDYASWYREHGGAVLSAAIRRHCYVTCRPLPAFHDFKTRVVWSRIELVRDHAEIEHPAVRAVLAHRRLDRGLEIHHDGELPARSGLGSSSAFVVGLLQALSALAGERPSAAALAREANLVERELLGEHGGIQDPIQIAHGGLNRIDIAPDGGFRVTPLALRAERRRALQERLVLLYLGRPRPSSRVAQEMEAAIPGKQPELHRMRELVDEADALLVGDGDLDELGRLLHQAWTIKRSLTRSISNSAVDAVYARARTAGALGGKLLGAGQSGFMLFYVRPDDRDKLTRALADLPPVPVEFEDAGASIVLESPPAPPASPPASTSPRAPAPTAPAAPHG